ncbi:MAG TPA: superoxide dismutase, partial [Dermatophilaceae bacterium]|nr:superoxide dismutase [Dermatophilaceae bacterium]
LVGIAIPLLAISLAPQAQAHSAPLRHVSVQGSFVPPISATNAFAYDLAQIPAGATARVDAFYLPGGRTVVVLAVRGLLPDRDYGAHAHAAACGVTGAAAGPHFQYAPDPVQPSVNPAFANEDNEIWLDFTTDAKGRGWAFAVQDWQPSAVRRPASVVIHVEHTHDGTDGFPAGTAGARLACLTVGF